MREGEAWLSAHELRVELSGQSELVASFPSFQFAGRLLGLLGDASLLLRACLHPKQIRGGSLQILGRPASEGLLSGDIGYCPSHFPVLPSARVKEVLLVGARLIGNGKSSVEDALQTVASEALGAKTFSSLTRLESSLVGLAHGILSHPKVLFIDDLFASLDELEAELFAEHLDRELRGRSAVFRADPTSPFRHYLEQTEAVLVGNCGEIVGPVPPKFLAFDCLWVTLNEPSSAFSAELEARGATLQATTGGRTYLIRRADARAILAAAEQAGVFVRSLVPGGLPLAGSPQEAARAMGSA